MKVYYFGCLKIIGHYWFNSDRVCLYWPLRNIDVEFPSSWDELVDGGLLKNKNVEDEYTGEVHYTFAKNDWTAFYWWDNSVDKRKGSNSGLYVQGFSHDDVDEAFKYACEIFDDVVNRQKFKLKLV